MDIKLINISKKYFSTDNTYITSLTNINIDINYGSYISFVGPSGSGKTTLLNIISGNLKPSSGEVYWGKFQLSKTPDYKISKLRREKFGIVFQDVKFINEISVRDNILLPVIINYIPLSSKMSYFQTLSEKLRLGTIVNKMPLSLSGGEKKKVAIARALITNPEILLADEPTANLDDTSAREIFHIFSDLNKLGLTIVVATHDERFGIYCRETYFIKNGKIEGFKSN
ncbi:MAG: ABC transporter ATP-binding protein [Brevinematia bacterium]